MDDMQKFLSRLKSLSFIEPGDLPELTSQQREAFARDPVRHFIRCDDVSAAAIWREIERAHSPR